MCTPMFLTRRAVDVSSADAVEQVRHDGRVLVRFGLFFAKYRPECWWYECGRSTYARAPR